MGYVYFVHDGNGLTKIGCSKYPSSRALQFGDVAHVIQTDDMYRLEQEVHDRLKDHKIRGEWFELCPQDLSGLRLVSRVTYGPRQIPRPLKEKGVLWIRHSTGWIRWRMTYYVRPDGTKAQKKSYGGFVSDKVLNRFWALMAQPAPAREEL